MSFWLGWICGAAWPGLAWTLTGLSRMAWCGKWDMGCGRESVYVDGGEWVRNCRQKGR
jgi:hypothetical protein